MWVGIGQIREKKQRSPAGVWGFLASDKTET
jgi:hypothetical protein